jgi:hypothetical protein
LAFKGWVHWVAISGEPGGLFDRNLDTPFADIHYGLDELHIFITLIPFRVGCMLLGFLLLPDKCNALELLSTE